jgi:hypothetical protein
MTTPNQPQDPYSAPEGGQGAGDQSGQGGIPQYGQYSGSGDQPGGYGQPASGQPGAYGQPGGYGQPAPYPQGGYGGYGSAEKNNLAVWSLVLAIVGFFVCSIFTSIPGIVLGSKAKQAVARGEANNGSLANAGYITSWVVTVLQVLGIILFIILIATGVVATEFSTDTSF